MNKALTEDRMDEVPSQPPEELGGAVGIPLSKVNTPRGSTVPDNIVGPMAMQTLRQNDEEHMWRKQYLRKSFYLVSCVLYMTFVVVLLVGVGLIDLTDKVLITMLATTVAHVVGILAIAFHWLYPHGGSNGRNG